MKVNGKDYPIYYGKSKMFQTTNQLIYIILWNHLKSSFWIESYINQHCNTNDGNIWLWP